MARNFEKNFTQLNRFLFAKQQEYLEKKKIKRPRLETLTNAADVKKWIPKLKSEIYFCLRHLSGIRNYSDQKIAEFQVRLARAREEYKKWVTKCLELDPTPIGVPGERHGYVNKRKLEEIRIKRTQNNKILSYESLNIDPKMMTPEEFSEIFGDSFEEVEDFPEIEESDEENESKDAPISEKIETPLLDLEEKEVETKKQKLENISDPNAPENQPLISYFNPPTKSEALELLSAYNSDSE